MSEHDPVEGAKAAVTSFEEIVFTSRETEE